MELIDYKKAITLFLKYFGIVLTICSGIFTLIGFLFSDYLKENWPVYIITILSIILISSLLCLVKKLIRQEQSVNDFIDKAIADKTTISIPDQLLDIVSKLTKEQSERLTGPIARFLHLNGHHEELIKLGHLLIENQDIKNLVFIKIDLLGWAYHIKDRTDTAILNINYGVEKAKDNHLYYWAAKGERHLAAIEKDRRNELEYKKHFDSSWSYTKQIQNIDDKNEMEGSLHYLQAKHLTEQKQFSQAETEANTALNLFSNDKERVIKVYVAFGNIYLEQEQWDKAHEMFLKGYKGSKGVRKDETAKSAVGLAKICLNPKAGSFFNINRAKNYLMEAELLKDTLKPRDRKEIESLLESLQ